MYTLEEGYWRSPEELLQLLGTQPSLGEQFSEPPSGAPVVVAMAESAASPNRVRRARSSYCAPPESDRNPAKRATGYSPLRLADDGLERLQESAISATKRRGGKRRQRVERTEHAPGAEPDPERVQTNRIAGEATTHARNRRRKSKEPESPVLATFDPETKRHSLKQLSSRRKRASAREELARRLTPSSSPVTEDENQSMSAPAAGQPGARRSGSKDQRLKSMHLSKQTRTVESDDDFSVSVATEGLPVGADDVFEADDHERVSHLREAPSSNPLEKMSVHSNHPTVSSTNALSVNALTVNARTVCRIANGARRLSPPLMDAQRGKGLAPAIQKPFPGEIVVDRRDGRKLRVIGVPPDGNCGYECLARGVNATLPRPSYTRSDIRRAMRTYVRSNRESVQALVNVVMVGEKRLGHAVPSLDTFDKAIMKKGISGHWLGSSYGLVEIMIAAKAVGMIIELFAVEPLPRAGKLRGFDRQARTVRPYERVGSGANVIRLLFEGKSSAGHFSLLLRA